MLTERTSYHDGARIQVIRDNGAIICTTDRPGGPGEREPAHTVWQASPALNPPTYLRAVAEFEEALSYPGSEVRHVGRMQVLAGSPALEPWDAEADHAAQRGLRYAAAAIAERAAQEGISQLKLRTQHADLFIHLRSGRLSAAASMDIRDALGALIAATAASGLDPAELAERLAPMYDFRPLASRA